MIIINRNIFLKEQSIVTRYSSGFPKKIVENYNTYYLLDAANGSEGYNNYYLHRLDGPAIVRRNSNQEIIHEEYFQTFPPPIKYYSYRSRRHRLDGPAYLSYKDGVISYSSYYIDGESIGENLNLWSEEDIRNYWINKQIMS